MHKVYRCGELPLVHCCGNRRWVEEAVFARLYVPEEKYFSAAFSEGHPLGAAAGRCHSQLFPVAP